MYRVSDKYKKANLEPSRQFESDITIGTRKLTNENLISFTIQQSIQQDETFSVGNAISSCMSLMFLHNDIEVDDKDIVNLKLGLMVDESYEYIPLGVYNIYSVSSSDTTTTLLCYDNMIKFDKLYVENSENPTLYSVINRLVEITGVSFGGVLSDYKDYKLSQLQGYSCREILGYVAGVLGSNSVIDRTGKFNFVSLSTHPLYNVERFELATKDGNVVMTKASEVLEVNAEVGFVDANNYYDYTKKNKNYKITQIINAAGSEEMSLGSIYDDTVYLYMQNPFINEEILKDIYDKMNGLEFLPYSLNWSGDIAVDVGDLITVTDKKEVMRCHPVLSQTITYNGALNVIAGANGDTKLANTYTIKTKEEAELDRTQEDLNETINEVNGVKTEIITLQDSIELKVEKKEVETIKEELQSNIDGVNNNLSIIEKDVTSVKDNVASINIDLNGITQKVSSVESTTTSLTEKVSAAQNTADSKAKIFVTTPTVPYKIGDLWVQGSSGDVMRCKVARESGSYTSTDWEKASKYTDDTTANAAKTTASNAQSTANANKVEIESTKSKVSTIETNLEGITQRVSSTEETITTHTTELGKVDGKISSAKTDAISTAATDASTKASNAQTNAVNSAKGYTDGQITTVNKTISDKVTEIKATTDGITQRVQSTEESINTINGDVTSLEGRVNTAEQQIKAESIISTVSKEFYKKTETDDKYLTSSSSTITQLSDSIESKVSSDDVSTLVKQNATSWGLSIDGKLKGTNYTFDGDNFTIGSSTGDTTAYHNNSQSKWIHSDGSYSVANSEGIMHYNGNSAKSYHYLTATGTVEVGQDENGAYPTYIDITLPEEFQNKWFTVTVSVAKCFVPSRMTPSNRDKFLFLGFETSYSITNYQRGVFRIYGRGTYLDFSNSQYYGGEVLYSAVRVNYTVVA